MSLYLTIYLVELDCICPEILMHVASVQLKKRPKAFPKDEQFTGR